MLLKKVRARKIPDSRNEPTIEVSINGCKASSPSGKSKGKHETPAFHNSLEWNINFLNKTKFNLEINSFDDLNKLESFVRKKARLNDVKQFGADALFALESAVLKALAKEKGKEIWQIINPKAKKLPFPVANAVGGGLHSHNLNKPVFQEFLLIPEERTFIQNYRIIKNIHKKLKKILKANSMNDEGAWQTNLNDEQILEILSRFRNIKIGIDIAASSFCFNRDYIYKNKTLDRGTQIHYVNDLIRKFNLFYAEDPLHEEDFRGFKKVKHSESHLVVGDDFTATQISRLKKAIKLKSINAMIIKPNQNGSLIELAEIFRLCKKHNIKTILSHRSGETLDDALADYAVGFQADFIKCGIATKWREVKLKRLIEIERSLKR